MVRTEDDFACSAPAEAGVAELQCEIVADFARLEELATDWESLWRSYSHSEIFQSVVWTRAWWQCFGNGLQLCTVVVRQRNHVVLILPLVRLGTKLRFLGFPQADYCDVLCCHPQPERPLFFALNNLLRSIPEWKECVFEGLRADSQLVGAWRQLPREMRLRLQAQVTDICPTIVLGKGRKDVMEALLRGKHLRRRLHQLQKAGVVGFRHIEDRNEAQQQLENFFRCHQQRCSVLSKISCFAMPAMRDMTRTLVAHLDLRSELRFGVLELDRRPIAWSIGFQAHGKYAYYQQTFDLDAEQYAPGEVLLHYLLLYARESVEREFDFLLGDEFFKRRFATHLYQRQILYFQRSGAAGQARRLLRGLQGSLRAAQSRIESFVRAHEQVFHVIRTIAVSQRSLRRRVRWAREAGEFPSCLCASCFNAFRRILWTSHVAVLFQRRSGSVSVLPESPLAKPEIQISIGRLSDLADLALEHCAFPFPGFRECRGRLKRGDHVYLVRCEGKLALVAWAGVRPATALSNISKASPQVSSNRAFAMYECWPIDSPNAGCARLMSVLASEAVKRNKDLLICCPAIPSRSQLALARQGFLPKLGVTSRAILRCLRWKSAKLYPLFGPRGSANDDLCPKLGRRRQEL